MNLLRRFLFCRTGRHTWLYLPEETAAGGRVCGPWVWCPACQTTQKALDEPPAAHPESLTVELPPEQEEWLAALDRELWSKEAA